MREKDFNPRPPRGGRHPGIQHEIQHRRISIHALREEGDPRMSVTVLPSMKISIHALREEGDWPELTKRCINFRFQSTPSARRATQRSLNDNSVYPNFNPRPPRGGRRSRTEADKPFSNFNPRPPRGGRRKKLVPGDPEYEFQSTPSARRATSVLY